MSLTKSPSFLLAALFALGAAQSAKADWKAWKATTSPAYWDVSDNWKVSTSANGPWNFDTSLQDFTERTVVFQAMETSAGTLLRLDRSTASEPIVFQAYDGNSGYGLSTSVDLYIAGYSEAEAYLKIDSGTYTFRAIYIGGKANCTSTVKMTGGALKCASSSGNYYLNLGRYKNCTATLIVSSGASYDNLGAFNANTVMCYESGTTAILDVNGGSVTLKGPLMLNYNSSSVSSTVNVSDGGVLTTKAFDLRNAGKQGATVTVDGGTLKAYADYSQYLPYNDNLSVYVGANGATIDANTHNITIGAVIKDKAGEHGVVTFTGGGTITLSGTPTYTGGTTNVAGTTLSLTAEAKAAIVEHPIAVVIPESRASDGTVVFEVTGGTFTQSEVDEMVITGKDAERYALLLADNDTKVAISDTHKGEYVWVGSAEDDWRTPGNWSKNGTLGNWYDSTAAVFANAGDLATVDADVTAASITFRENATIAAGGGTLSPGTVVVSNGVSATINAPTAGALVKKGPGTLTLASSRTAQTDLLDGTLVMTGKGTAINWSNLALGSAEADNDVAVMFEDNAALVFPGNVDVAMGVVPGRVTEIHKNDGNWDNSWNFILSNAKNATTRLYHRVGTMTLGRYVRIGYNAESDSGEARFEISGGTVTHNRISGDGYVDVGANGKPGFRSVLSVITNGTFGTVANLVVGGHGAGTLDINGGAVDVSNGVIPLCYGTGNEVGEDCAIDIANGGSLTTKGIQYGESASKHGAANATITFNDGTLKAAADGTLIAANDKLSVTVAAGGGTIDANGKKVTIDEDLAGAGGMTYKGGGSVTLSVAPACSGKTTVEVGTALVVPSVIAGANLVFTIPEGLATGIYKVMEISGGGAFSADILSSVTLPTDVNAHFFLYNDNKEIRCVYSTGATDNIWIGGESGRLDVPANWSSGSVPASGTAIIGNPDAAALTNPEGSAFAAVRIVIPSGSAAVTISGADFSGVTQIVNNSTSVAEFQNAVTFSANVNVIQNTGAVKFTGGATGVQLGTKTDIHGTYNFTIVTNSFTEIANTVVKSDGVYKLLDSTFFKHNGDFTVEVGGKAEVGAAKINRSTSAYLLDNLSGEFKVNGEFGVTANGADKIISHYLANSGTGTLIVDKIRVATYGALVPRNKTIMGGGGIIRGNGYVRVYNSGSHEFGAYDDWTMYHDNLGNTTTSSPVFCKHSNSTANTTLTFDTTDYYDNTIGRTITCEAPICGEDAASAAKFLVAVKGKGRFVFANTSDGNIFSGGLTVNDSATVEVKPNAWPGKGAVTMNGTSTLLMHTNTLARTGAIMVNKGATLKVAESGTAKLGGNLTLKDGATLAFNFTERRTAPVLDIAGNGVTFDKGSTTNVTVKVSAAEGVVPSRADNQFELTSGGGFDPENVTVSFGEADKPDWVKNVFVNNASNIVLVVKSVGTRLFLR